MIRKKNHFSFLFRFQKNISKSLTMPNCKPLFQGLSTITKFCPSHLAMRVLWSLKVMSFSHQLNITVCEHCYFSMQMACFNFGSTKSGAAQLISHFPSPTFYTDKKITSLSSLTKLSHCHLTGTEFSNSRQANQKIIVRISRPLLEKKALKFGMVIVLERYFQNLKERKVTF